MSSTLPQKTHHAPDQYCFLTVFRRYLTPTPPLSTSSTSPTKVLPSTRARLPSTTAVSAKPNDLFTAPPTQHVDVPSIDDHIPVLLRLDRPRSDGRGRQSGRELAFGTPTAPTPRVRGPIRTANLFKFALFKSITDLAVPNDVRFTFTSSHPERQPSSASASRPPVRTAEKVRSYLAVNRTGQTINDQFGSNFRLQGEEQTQIVQSNAGSCAVTVKAPQFVLVFVENHHSVDPIEFTDAWPTSIATELGGTAVVDPSVLATSNGRGGAQEAFNIGGTSSGSQVYASAGQKSVFLSGALAGVVATLVGGWAVLYR